MDSVRDGGFAPSRVRADAGIGTRPDERGSGISAPPRPAPGLAATRRDAVDPAPAPLNRGDAMPQNGWTGDDPDLAPYEDTVALLQEEIAKLEHENRILREARDAGLRAAPVADTSALESRYEGRIRELSEELKSREETLHFLLDQLALAEQAELAGRQERQQLHHWITEIEKRVERQNREEDPERLAEARRELERLRREYDAHRQNAELERKALTASKERLESEIARLNEHVAEMSEALEANNANASILQVMEEENQRLRRTCVELTETAVRAAEAEELRRDLEELSAELEEANRRVRLLQDERDREANEREAQIAALRAQLARETLQAQRAVESLQYAASRDTSIDERIRAFRLHLQEVHHQEEQERQRAGITSRLSKVWIKTRPR